MGLGQTTTILFEDEDGVFRPVSTEHPLPSTGSGGGGGGAVDSVNGQTGVVVLDAGDVNARPDDWEPDLSAYATTASLPAAVAANESLQSIVGGDNVTVDDTDPRNPVINASGGGGGDVASVNGQTGIVVLDAEDVNARPDTWEPDLTGYATVEDLADKADASVVSTLAGEVTDLETDLSNKADAGVEGLVPGSSLHVYWTGTEWPVAPTVRADITIFWHGGTSADPAPLRENIDVWLKAVE